MEEDKIVQFEEFRREKLAKAQEDVKKVTQKAEKRNRVHTSDYILMVGTALFFDALQIAFSLIPVAGWMLAAGVGFFAWMTFYLWSSVKGWGMSDSIKQIIVNVALPVVEFIPILDVLPLWTLKTVLQLSFLKAEDALYNVTGGRADLEKVEKIYKKVA